MAMSRGVPKWPLVLYHTYILYFRVDTENLLWHSSDIDRTFLEYTGCSGFRAISYSSAIKEDCMMYDAHFQITN